ncbi:hypothetical protein ABE426_18030 [Sphingobacterium faecium]|uniref:hypothetical protein n=1 Tax=Sphingobacterium faecium TaxID=34087 RepID=UPI00320838A1
MMDFQQAGVGFGDIDLQCKMIPVIAWGDLFERSEQSRFSAIDRDTAAVVDQGQVHIGQVVKRKNISFLFIVFTGRDMDTEPIDTFRIKIILLDFRVFENGFIMVVKQRTVFVQLLLGNEYRWNFICALYCCRPF